MPRLDPDDPARRDRPWPSLFWILAFFVLLVCWAWARPACAEPTTTVRITVREQTPMRCPARHVLLTRQPDGTYQREPLGPTLTLDTCWHRTEWQEEWTDYPEQGGRFLRRVS